jgi:hypothetical protein
MAWRVFAYQYGHLNTAKNWECRDASGSPIPWYTYPAIDFLNQLDLSGKSVFEYGSGFSTLYWSKKATRVVSLEHDKFWYDKISPDIPQNVKYLLETDTERYASRIFDRFDEFDEQELFDIIVVDGVRRFQAAQNALKTLKGDGFIILDNADWYPRTARCLRETLTQVDFIGFSPINPYTFNTSFFLSPGAAFRRLETADVPQALIGNIRQRAEDD